MRVVQSILLFIFSTALVTFILQNTDTVTIKFLGWHPSAPMAVICLALYLLGMSSGWAVLNFLRSTFRRIQHVPQPPAEPTSPDA